MLVVSKKWILSIYSSSHAKSRKSLHKFMCPWYQDKDANDKRDREEENKLCTQSITHEGFFIPHLRVISYPLAYVIHRSTGWYHLIVHIEVKG